MRLIGPEAEATSGSCIGADSEPMGRPPCRRLGNRRSPGPPWPQNRLSFQGALRLGNFTAILKQFGFRNDEIRIEPIESMAADRRRYVDRVVASDASVQLMQRR